MSSSETPNVATENWDLREMSDQFWRHGFLVIPNFFNPGLMDCYEKLITQHFGHNPDFEHESEFLEKAATEVIPWFPQREGATEFDRAQNNQSLNQYSTSILILI